MSFIELPYFNSKDGSITKIFFRDSLIKEKIEEIYINGVNYGKTKGWIYHKKANLYLHVVSGDVEFSSIKKDCYSKGNDGINHIKIGYKDKKMLFIKKNTWFKFKGISKYSSKILVLSDQIHDPSEIIKSPPNLFPKFDK